MRWTAGLIAMLITAGCSSPTGTAPALNDTSGSELTRDDNDIAGDEAALGDAMTASISDASDTSPVAPSGEDDGQAEGRAEDTSINPGPAPETGDEEDALAGIDDDSDAAQGPGPRPEADSEPGAPLEHCEALGLSIRAFNTEGPFGVRRHDVADDFTFYPYEGDPWVLSEEWTGCDVYVFITDARPNSALDPTSIWNRDLETLLLNSPLNAHYFFVETSSASQAMTILGAMQARVDAALAALPEQLRGHWSERLHVAGGHFSALGGYFSSIFYGPAGFYGFAIDRAQEIRLLGSFADVNRYSEALSAGEHWPWEANMAYAAHEVRHFNFEATREARLAAEEDVTVVSAWSDEVLSGDVETDVNFPTAEQMTQFDTLEIDLTMDCPDPEGGEFGNCGAWDYLSHIYLQDSQDEANWIELARFITTYHREGRYVVDATAALAHLRGGGQRRLRFHVSPSWNPQAYLTQMDFRFRSQDLGHRPVGAQSLFGSANFNAAYNDNFEPIEVVVPPETSHATINAIITGHGMDTNNCAEFCDHHHTFTVNGVAFKKTHPAVGQAEGCISQIEDGMVPNQGGTWWFGRGGWCPGQHVVPWVIDLSEIAAPGETLVIEYSATLAGATPPDNAGNIRLTSHIIWFE